MTAVLHYQSNIGPIRRAIAYFCASLMFLVSFLPALALATTITLPPSSTQNLTTIPTNIQGELFAGPPSFPDLIIDNPAVSRHFNSYSINLDAGTAYTFRLSDFEFNVLWFVTDSVGTILLSSVHSMSIAGAQELRLAPATTGTYHIIISSALGTETGTYTLAVNTLPNPSIIEGRVVNAANQPLANIQVTAHRQVGASAQFIPELSTTTSSDGSFSLSPLTAGNYRISFFDVSFTYGSIHYHQASSFENATIVQVLAGGQTVLTDTVLERGASITGTVVGTNNVPLENILVSAYTLNQGRPVSIASTETDASGTYVLTGLRAGSYFIRFSCPNGFFITQYFDNVSSMQQASAVTATLGVVTTNIDARLESAATISGVVLNSAQVAVADVVVSLLRTRAQITNPTSLDCFEVVTQDITGSNGAYFLGGIEAGRYFLHFSDTQGRFLDLFYASAFTADTSSPLEIVQGLQITNKNVTLTRTSTLSGTVADTNLEFLSGIRVRLFDLSSAPSPITQEFLESPSFETHTDDAGNFTFFSLIPGTYLLEFFDITGRHSTIYHFNQDDPNLANHITIVPNTHLTGHNATLRAASSITGTVADEVTGLILNRANVLLFDANDTSTPLAQTTTNQRGVFTFGGLDAGTYYIAFAPQGYQIPESLQFFDATFDITYATPISIGYGVSLDLDHLYFRPLPTATLTLNGRNNTAPTYITVTKGSTIDYLPEPTFLGHRFEGWHTRASGGQLIEAPLTLDADLTLYAHWRAADFIFTFDPRGGSELEQQFYYFGDQVQDLPTPIRAGHSFQGWFDRPVGGFRINEGDLVTRSMTLYARWQVAAHTITFNSHGGSSVARMTRNYGQTLGPLPTPNRQFHTFSGWFSAATGGTRIQSNHVVRQNMTLHARWTPQMVTVRFDTQGGNRIADRRVQAGNRLGNLPTPTRNNRVFARWTTDRAGNRAVNANTIATGNLTLFAQWRSNDARLRGISRSAGTLNRPFSPNVLNYTLSLRANTASVRITPLTRCNQARIAMRTSNNQSFVNRNSITISVPRGQSRVLQIRVTSEDGKQRHIYRVTIRRA